MTMTTIEGEEAILILITTTVLVRASPFHSLEDCERDYCSYLVVRRREG